MSKKRSGFSRRDVLLAGGAGLVGGALAYRGRSQLRGAEIAARALPLETPDEAGDFVRNALEIKARHALQTPEDVAALREKYTRPVFGRVQVWEMVQRLALCVDPTDRRIFGGSQWLHVQQILSAMERNGVEDRELLLTALVHDLGKLLLLTDEAPENVVASCDPLTEGEPGCGLDALVFQYGHAEFMYTRLVGHVPEPVAWLVRYHGVQWDDVEPFMDARDREYTERYLKPFRGFDAGFGSPYFLPQIDVERYRALLEEALPRPIAI